MQKNLDPESAIGTVNQINKFTKGVHSRCRWQNFRTSKSVKYNTVRRYPEITSEGKSIYGVILQTVLQNTQWL